MPAIATLTAEHDEIRAVAREAVTAAHAGGASRAAAACARLLELLTPHTAIEERGLFPAMAAEFADHMSSLEADHHRIEATLAVIAAGPPLPENWTAELDCASDELFDHILREQDGLFPAALSVFRPEHWDRLDTVRREVVGIVPAPQG